MFKKACMSHKNSPTATQAAQVRKLGIEGSGDSEIWLSNSTVVEAVVLDDAI